MSSWILEFHSRPSAKFFVEIDAESISNLSTPFLDKLPYGESAKNLILNQFINDLKALNSSMLQSSAELLYGLIHAQFIKTPRGLILIKEKFIRKEFGTCSRVYCRFSPLLPIGLFDEFGNESVKLFCSCCLDVYRAPSIYSNVDGSFFGTGFAALFYKSFESDILQIVNFLDDESSSDSFMTSDVSSMSFHSMHEKFNNQGMYVPKIFGFRVNELADHGPKNAWLRVKENLNFRSGTYQ